jgi:uncharacterized protein YjbI with pentapeptide repeats
MTDTAVMYLQDCAKHRGKMRAKGNAMESNSFEPPKYLASLIAAVNEGGKAAQAGALFFALVGLYLLATAFSISDEDLLRGRTITISQIGASLPVSFSFAIAPFVFVFLHIYTLVRHDMLNANVRQFLAELRETVPLVADRERCRQLLANTEFIQALVALPGSRLYSPVWRWLFRMTLAVFPVVVLVLVQINALRYQSDFITWVQRLVLLIDMCALFWFFYRNPLGGSAPDGRLARTRRWVGLLWLPAAVIGLNLLYLNVVPVEADVQMVRYAKPPEPIYKVLADVLRQPLDVILCPRLNWGCRYLRVEHRTIIDRTYDDKAIAELRNGAAHSASALAAIDGVVLTNRSLRFGMFEGTSLFAADLTHSDLRKASLARADLEGAQLFQTQLQEAELSLARLRFANLFYANLQGAHLYMADLQGAQMLTSWLQGASLRGASLQGAQLGLANLRGADLTGAQLQLADLSLAKLQGAELSVARLQGTSMRQTELQGASLRGARLQAAHLAGAQLQGADLNQARLWRVKSDNKTNLSLADLVGTDFATPLTDEETTDLKATLSAIREGSTSSVDKMLIVSRNQQAEDVSGRFFGTEEIRNEFVFTASAEQPVLVVDPKSPIFEKIPSEWLITSPTASYARSLIELLANQLAPQTPRIAANIANRAQRDMGRTDSDDKLRSLYATITCRLLENAQADKVSLERFVKEDLSRALDRQKVECDAAIRPLPPQPGIRGASDIIAEPR